MKTLRICIILVGLMIASSVQASSFILKPNVVAVQAGETFTLPVVVDPAGKSQYTVRLSITFSPDLLEVASFIFDKNWIAVSQPGYDVLDNKQGKLIKTAGFPKGFSSTALFGTIVFKAKGPGTSVISVSSPQSFILNAKNESTLESRPQAKVISAEGSVPNISSVTPLPNLPVKETNIFDIIQKPVLPAKQNVIPLIFFSVLAGIVLVLFVIFIMRWVKKVKI
ncbi:MAG: hypothetical protein CEN87_262 [Parcubacteria group bacterium Licking1014_1]|nr:MAG: hypothetical protein CEN87_262 [Parcubacteria group bacterium Licking1014_1]